MGKPSLQPSRGPQTGSGGHYCLRISPHKARQPPPKNIEDRFMFFTICHHMNPQILLYVCSICFWIMEGGFDYCGFMCEVHCVISPSSYKKILDVSCVSCSCRSKPVLNSQLLRWEWFCSSCITSSCLTGPEWENIHCFKEYKQWLLMFTAVTYHPPLQPR